MWWRHNSPRSLQVTANSNGMTTLSIIFFLLISTKIFTPTVCCYEEKAKEIGQNQLIRKSEIYHETPKADPHLHCQTNSNKIKKRNKLGMNKKNSAYHI